MAFPAGVLTCTRLTAESAPAAVLTYTRLTAVTAKKPRLRRACGVLAAMLTITRLTAVTVPAAMLTITRLKKRTQSGAFLLIHGVPGGSRTHGLSLRRRTLYPTELRKHTFCKSIIYYAVWKIKQFYAAGAIHLR